MHINEKGQMALTLADGLCDIGISSVYQHDTLTINSEGGHMTNDFQLRQKIFSGDKLSRFYRTRRY